MFPGELGDEAGPMTSSVNPGTIIVGYDGSHHADQALNWAAEQAAIEKRTLTLVHVVRDAATFEVGNLATRNILRVDVHNALVAEAHLLLAEARTRALTAHEGLDVATVLAEGDPRKVLLDLSEHASALVLGSRGRGRLTSLLLGSVSIAIARHASCPAIVVRPHHPGKVRRGVLVGTDCGEHTRSTLEFAYRQASLRRLPLTVVYCVPYLSPDQTSAGFVPDDAPGFDDHRCLLAEAVAGMAEKFPDVRVRTTLGHGVVDRCLVTASSVMDLVVVGRHHTGTRGDVVGLGAFAPAVIEGASCPVAVVSESAAPSTSP